jgi:hypothetical protein
MRPEESAWKINARFDRASTLIGEQCVIAEPDLRLVHSQNRLARSDHQAITAIPAVTGPGKPDAR